MPANRVIAKTKPVAIRSQKPSLIQIDDESLRSFDSTFREISAFAHVCIISEGAPQNTSLSVSEVSKLRQAMTKLSPDSTDETIRILANAFDYDVKRQENKIFLLVKKYSDSNELPLVTYDEILHSLESILKIIDAFSPSDSRLGSRSLENLYDSLTPEQQTHAKAGMSFSDLTGPQREIANAALRYVVLDSRVATIRSVAQALPALKDKTAVFRWVDAVLPDTSHTTAFGYEGKFGFDGSVIGRPITYPFKSAGSVGYRYYSHSLVEGSGIGPQSHGRNGLGVPHGNFDTRDSSMSSADPASPNELDYNLAARGLNTSSLTGVVSLREALHAADLGVSPRSIGGRVESGTYEVADSIAGKPVGVFGAQNAGDERTFMRALAEVYGLQLVVDLRQHYRIILPVVRLPDSANAVPAAITRATPPSLMRAILTRYNVSIAKQRAEKGFNGASSSAATGSQMANGHTPYEGDVFHIAAFESYDSLYFPAVRRLVALAKPAVPTAESSPVPVAQLAPESNRLIAMTMLSGTCAAEVDKLRTYVPPACLVKPESTIFQINRSMSGDAPLVTVVFTSVHNDGKVHFEGRAGTMTIPPGGSSIGAGRLH